MKSKISAPKFANPSSSQDDSSSGSDFSNFDDDHFTKTTSTSSSLSSRSYDCIKSPTFKYTSLREIAPASPPSPPEKSSATAGIRGSSWNEIPIRNPLVKQAALAYLQPMASPPESVEQGLFGKFKDVCCGGQCGCLGWFNGVVSGVVRDVFGKEKRRRR